MKSFKEFSSDKDLVKSYSTEAMTIQQRLKRSRLFKKIKNKIAIGRKKAAKKIANPKQLLKRSLKKARLKFFKKITKGQAPGEVSLARRNEIEKKLDKMKSKIKKFATKILPQVRKDEIAKKRKSKENK
tara:strand:+ start:991 stop:1377 length:387 start_codon:yes stop_codon:yes gene_type:complete